MPPIWVQVGFHLADEWPGDDPGDFLPSHTSEIVDVRPRPYPGAAAEDTAPFLVAGSSLVGVVCATLGGVQNLIQVWPLLAVGVVSG